ncbi:MAG: hypothetical protein A2W25_13785 [candidate division Zixibacteria bacterium RBG_16_53_22]|nr:MAG: hypothetical protein A2W25_13785 [candidate division Zixibacteria bacterium RBG_16_53_22]
MFGFRRNKPGVEPLPSGNLARKVKIIRPAIGREKAGAGLRSGQAEINFPADYGHYERITLYRFLRENIPIVNGAIWVWARLCAGPMEFTVRGDDSTRNAVALKSHLEKLNVILASSRYGRFGGLDRLCDLFFSSLFVDGAFAGGLQLDSDGRLLGFAPCDIRSLSFERDSKIGAWNIFLESGGQRSLLDPASFIYVPLDEDVIDPRGKSVLQSVGFVSRIEQKILDDMQKAQEKAGYNRLHVVIKKPERRMGETESAYIERANGYFDDTVTLFSGIRPSDSAVTWDDVEIKTISPEGGAGSSWYLSHRAIVEDICAGVHLDPFMLGYSYSSTQTWARFKYELVLREIVSVQKLAVRFFEWLVNGYLDNVGAGFLVDIGFDNDRVYSLLEQYRTEQKEVERVADLFKAGLLSREEARERIFRLEGVE